MKQNFSKCLNFTLNSEGGYSNNSQDNSNWWNGQLVGSKFGITASDVWNYYKIDPITAEYMQDLTMDSAKEIIYNKYWVMVKGDELWSGLDLMIFDFGFNAGNGIAVRQMQALLGVNADGIVGPITLGVVNAISVKAKFLQACSNVQEDYYRSLSEFGVFGRGWISRTEARLKLSLEMLNE